MITSLVLYFVFSHVFSFLCSIFEAVLLSCTPAFVEGLKRRGSKSGLILERLNSKIDRPLAAILTVNTISHTFGAAGVGASVLAIFGEHYVALGSVILTLTMLYWTEMFPKTLGAIYWRELAPVFARPIQILIWITAPFVYSFSSIAKLLARGRGGESQITEEDIRGALASGARTGVIKEEEQEMVENIFRLADRSIGVIMVPRVDLSPLDIGEGIEKIRTEILESTAERHLLCDGRIDAIIGVIETHDLLKAVWTDQVVDLSKLAKQPTFIHENQCVFEFMELHERTDCKMALVTDEYGIVQGAVSMDEVVDAIVKDIDQSGTGYFHQLNPKSWLLDGKMPIDEFKEIFHFSRLPDEERARYRTLGGLCMTLLGKIPEKGDVMILDAYRLEIIRTHRRRVEKLLLTRQSV